MECIHNIFFYLDDQHMYCRMLYQSCWVCACVCGCGCL